MRSFYELKQEARFALQGKWGIAIGASLVASLLSGGLSVSVSTETSATPAMIATAAVAALFSLALSLFLSSVITVGFCKFQLNLLDGKPLFIATLFDYFRDYWSVWKIMALQTLHIFIGTLLFVIPGIIASFNYALVPYLAAENPTRSARETLALSKHLMYGHRLEYFCLSLSFLGWAFLCVFTCGIGFFWLYPYMEATKAAFYRELTAGTANFYVET